MRILGLDLETDGLNTDTCHILEISMCLWDSATKRIMEARSYCFKDVKWDINDTSEAIKINGLKVALLSMYGRQNADTAYLPIAKIIENCDYICAHNGNNFDKPILDRHLNTYLGKPTQKPWIDTRTDIPFPASMTSKRLVHLAADHGFVNPFPHQGLFDVATMLRILGNYDIDLVIKNAKSPNVTMIAKGFPMDMNPALKERRFRWNPSEKHWWKLVKEFQVEEECRHFVGQQFSIEKT